MFDCCLSSELRHWLVLSNNIKFSSITKTPAAKKYYPIRYAYLTPLNTIISFTEREQQVLNILTTGLSTSYRQIALELALSPRTVEFYLKMIRQKAGAASKKHLITVFKTYKYLGKTNGRYYECKVD